MYYSVIFIVNCPSKFCVYVSIDVFLFFFRFPRQEFSLNIQYVVYIHCPFFFKSTH